MTPPGPGSGAVTGNHEYFSGFQEWITEVESFGLTVLRNQRVAIDGTDLAGVNDVTGVDLQLSGHTHGGQIFPFGYLVALQQPVIAGYARFNDTQLYVTRGAGFWGPPVRVGAPPDITLIELRSE